MPCFQKLSDMSIWTPGDSMIAQISEIERHFMTLHCQISEGS